jgi:hypothetical protein
MISILPLRVHNLIRQSRASHTWLCKLAPQEPWRLGMRNSRRMKAAALCRTVVLPSWIVACLAAFGSTGVENSGAPAVERTAPVVVADAVPGALPATVIGNAAAAFADVATKARSETVAATDTTTTSRKVEAIVEAALTDPVEVLPSQAQPMEVSTATRRNRSRATQARARSSQLSALSKFSTNAGPSTSASTASCGRSISGRRRRTPSRCRNSGR